MNYGSQDIQQEGRISEVRSEYTGCDKQLEEGAGGVEKEERRTAQRLRASKAYYLRNREKIAARRKRPARIPKTCCVKNCERKNWSHGYCSAHLQRFMHHGSVMEDIPVSKSRYGKRNSRWTGGVISDGHGRTLVYKPDHPYPSNYGTHVYRYRLVVEESIGRYLLPSEIVHHKNGDHTDDRIENLQVVSQSEHAKIHMAERLSRNGGWSFSHEKCLSCGTKDHKHEGKGLCIKCYRKRKTSK